MSDAPATLREKLKALCLAELESLQAINDSPRRAVSADEFAKLLIDWLRTTPGADQGRVWEALKEPLSEPARKRVRTTLHGFPPTNEKLKLLYLALIGESELPPVAPPQTP